MSHLSGQKGGWCGGGIETKCHTIIDLHFGQAAPTKREFSGYKYFMSVHILSFHSFYTILLSNVGWHQLDSRVRQ